MLVCYCGLILSSDGTNWVCPMRGNNLVLIGKDKGYHSGESIPDKRRINGRHTV